MNLSSEREREPLSRMSKQNFRAVICGIKEPYHLGKMLNFFKRGFYIDVNRQVKK